MGHTQIIFAVAIMIFSLAFIFIALILIPSKITKEKLEKIIGAETVEKIKSAKDEEEIKNIIRSLSNKQKNRLKTLMESQDINDVIESLKKYILKP